MGQVFRRLTNRHTPPPAQGHTPSLLPQQQHQSDAGPPTSNETELLQSTTSTNSSGSERHGEGSECGIVDLKATPTNGSGPKKGSECTTNKLMTNSSGGPQKKRTECATNELKSNGSGPKEQEGSECTTNELEATPTNGFGMKRPREEEGVYGPNELTRQRKPSKRARKKPAADDDISERAIEDLPSRETPSFFRYPSESAESGSAATQVDVESEGSSSESKSPVHSVPFPTSVHSHPPALLLPPLARIPRRHPPRPPLRFCRSQSTPSHPRPPLSPPTTLPLRPASSPVFPHQPPTPESSLGTPDRLVTGLETPAQSPSLPR